MTGLVVEFYAPTEGEGLIVQFINCSIMPPDRADFVAQ
jgi:hypothetical protein